MERGGKTFRGRVVINIDGSDLNVIQRKLGYNLHHLTPLARQTFLKQNKLSIVSLLKSGETEDEFFEKMLEADDLNDKKAAANKR